MSEGLCNVIAFFVWQVPKDRECGGVDMQMIVSRYATKYPSAEFVNYVASKNLDFELFVMDEENQEGKE